MIKYYCTQSVLDKVQVTCDSIHYAIFNILGIFMQCTNGSTTFCIAPSTHEIHEIHTKYKQDIREKRKLN